MRNCKFDPKCRYSKSQQIFVKFRFQPSLTNPQSTTFLYGYGNSGGGPDPPPDNARLNPDNLKGNVIFNLSLIQKGGTYGFEIGLSKALEKQFNEDTLKNFKFILNFNDINIQIPYSDLECDSCPADTFFDYDVYYDETKPNYHLIKKMINNGDIVGKNINVMMGKIESSIETCCLKTLHPLFGIKGAATNKGCGIRLRELNSARKPAPTKLQGSQVARENNIRRRVAVIKQIKNCMPDGQKFKGEECNEVYAYGPVFGLAKKPRYGGKCNNIYSANGGSSSDVTKWRRLYGGSRQLFNTASCKYACDQKITGLGLLKF